MWRGSRQHTAGTLSGRTGRIVQCTRQCGQGPRCRPALSRQLHRRHHMATFDPRHVSQLLALSTPNVSDALDRLGIEGQPARILPIYRARSPVPATLKSCPTARPRSRSCSAHCARSSRAAPARSSPSMARKPGSQQLRRRSGRHGQAPQPGRLRVRRRGARRRRIQGLRHARVLPRHRPEVGARALGLLRLRHRDPHGRRARATGRLHPRRRQWPPW